MTEARHYAQRIADTSPAILEGLEAAIEAMYEPRWHWWHALLPGLWTIQRRRFEKWREAHRRDIAAANAFLEECYSVDEEGNPLPSREFVDLPS